MREMMAARKTADAAPSSPSLASDPSRSAPSPNKGGKEYPRSGRPRGRAGEHRAKTIVRPENPNKIIRKKKKSNCA